MAKARKRKSGAKSRAKSGARKAKRAAPARKKKNMKTAATKPTEKGFFESFFAMFAAPPPGGRKT